MLCSQFFVLRELLTGICLVTPTLSFIDFQLFSFFVVLNELDINIRLGESNVICCKYTWNDRSLYKNKEIKLKNQVKNFVCQDFGCLPPLPPFNLLPTPILRLGLMVSNVNWGYIYISAVNKIIFKYIYIYTFIINTCSSMIQTMELITRALSAPSQPVLEDVDQTSRVVDRQICSENMIHQADLLMRKLTAEYMKEASRKDLVFIYYISFNAWKL